MELNRIYNMDCLIGMKDIPDGSVDMIWTDPPYNVGKDYGIYKDNLFDEEYLKWCDKWIKEAKRISENKMAIFTPTKYILQYWNMLGEDYKQIILSWTPYGTFRGNFINQYSSILVNVKPKNKIKNVWNNCQMSGLGYFFKENNYGNPGYTSEDITSRIINNFTCEKDIVCDLFSGTGTTAVIAVRYNRRYICMELNPKDCDIATKRISAEMAQMKLF